MGDASISNTPYQPLMTAEQLAAVSLESLPSFRIITAQAAARLVNSNPQRARKIVSKVICMDMSPWHVVPLVGFGLGADRKS